MNEYLLILFSIATAIVIVLLTIPKLIVIAHNKNIVDNPDHRKLNRIPIPTLGGIGIFLGIVVSSVLFTSKIEMPGLRFIFTGMTLLLYVGIGDDLLDMKATKKLLFQILAAAIVVIAGGIRFSNLNGLFGIYEIPVEFGCLLTLFCFVGLTNALNLIDGIDGLASGFGMLAASTLGTVFLLGNNLGYAVLSFATAGSLLPFFFFNVFGKRNKIFMGDTGSLILGVLFSALVVQVAETPYIDRILPIDPAPFLLAVFSVPVFDTLRVMTVRMCRGISPFCPDNRHLHHKILQLGFSHWTTTRVILLANISTVLLSVVISSLLPEIQIIIIIAYGFFITTIPAIILAYMVKRHPESLRRWRVHFYQKRKSRQPMHDKLTHFADQMK
ncbi:undecaprenyl/decaprenyl-phosphate alpha-N-acetylglucosaminyl 1-phosphate transferase [Puteibacter caeruleilacunae]|nr:undecaprenyl/decaprenyl-phosphate alpha-N-acetylglucosaminyl 1-phosphate transferase [Puteibacter caeruleilacunae]